MKIAKYLFIAVCLFLFFACTPAQQKNPPQVSIEIKEKCGDGFCDKLEKEKGICPQDCEMRQQDYKTPEKLYLSMMIHLEGWDDEVENEEKFNGHSNAARKFLAVFDKYNAKATVEARLEFVKAQNNWGDNVLKEFHEKGHGIGLHADLGGNAEEIGMSQEDMNQRLTDMKNQFEKLSGIKIQHASGICSSLDWVEAAIKAGLEFTTGGVAYCVMSMPEEDRPEEFKDCESPLYCHDTYPLEVKGRVHPWRVSDGANWLEHDPNGKLVYFAPENALNWLAEEETGSDAIKKIFDQKDIDAFMDRMQEALEYTKDGEISTMYVGWSIGDANPDLEVLDSWFASIQPYVESGQVEWMSVNDMYDEFLEWEQNVI